MRFAVFKLLIGTTNQVAFCWSQMAIYINHLNFSALSIEFDGAFPGFSDLFGSLPALVKTKTTSKWYDLLLDFDRQPVKAPLVFQHCDKIRPFFCKATGV